MPAKSTSNRYGTVAIFIHWLTVVMVFAQALGGFWAATTANPATQAAILRLHAPFGMAILVITLFRILWWLAFDKKPRDMASVPPIQNVAAKAVHGLLYLALLGMGLSGIILMNSSGAGEVLFGAGGTLPNFWDYTAFYVHAAIAWGLIILIIGHIGAALYHQFMVGDRLLGRMGLGQPPSTPQG
ncbi:MAG TPA: cytochrome b/b6 domain-containing protein [Aestuariivirga sp.]|nr:cytochrome b/b6 domain-containing protein [Aestuariivirga sp.]